jgi:protein-L-isoaspartate(D-aspartate) O-methyltransferase
MFYRKQIYRTTFQALPILLTLLILMILTTGCKDADTGKGDSEPEEETVLTEEEKYYILRYDMVTTQIIARGISDELTINAMYKVPRHEFVGDVIKDVAYADHPLPIGEGQTISQPYIVALMTENLELTGEEKVLEIGTGSGYQAAVLAEIVEEVYTVEIVTSLYQNADKALSSYTNVSTSNHDGYYGWEEHAPFDRIMVTAAPDHIPPPLVDQLVNGGIMVLPVGPPGYNQTLWKVKKTEDEVLTIKITDYVVFVPLTREVR